MPADLRPGLGENACVFDGEAHRSRARVFESPCIVEIEFVHRVAEFRNVDREMGNAVEQAEEDRCNGDVEARDVGAAQPAEPETIGVVHQYVQARERQKATAGVALRSFEPHGIASLRIAAVERTTGKDMCVFQRDVLRIGWVILAENCRSAFAPVMVERIHAEALHAVVERQWLPDQLHRGGHR